MCMQTVSIKLGRSKGRTHTHTQSILYTALLIPLSPPPPFQRGNSMLSNFFQMSSTSLPPFPCSIPSIFNSLGRLKPGKFCPLSLSLLLSFSPPPPPPPRLFLPPARSTCWSQRQNMTPGGQAGEAAALPKSRKECRSKCISHIA